MGHGRGVARRRGGVYPVVEQDLLVFIGILELIQRVVRGFLLVSCTEIVPVLETLGSSDDSDFSGYRQ